MERYLTSVSTGLSVGVNRCMVYCWRAQLNVLQVGRPNKFKIKEKFEIWL